jgi:hypothetical protein
MPFTLVQIFFWLALSTWFGAVLFIAMAPPIILRTIRKYNPLIPTVLSVNLEGRHGDLLAGEIMQEMIHPLHLIERVCSVIVLLTLIAQWFLIPSAVGLSLGLALLRTALYFAATVFLVYDWRVVWPRMLKFRQEYLDHADEPDIANPALEQFNKYQAESIAILRNILFLLMGMILFSASISPPSPLEKSASTNAQTR